MLFRSRPPLTRHGGADQAGRPDGPCTCTPTWRLAYPGKVPPGPQSGAATLFRRSGFARARAHFSHINRSWTPLFDANTDRRSLRRSMYASSSEAATKVRRPILFVDRCSGFQKRTGESRRRASYSTTMSLPDTDTVPRPRGQTFVSILNVVPSPGIFAGSADHLSVVDVVSGLVPRADQSPVRTPSASGDDRTAVRPPRRGGRAPTHLLPWHYATHT